MALVTMKQLVDDAWENGTCIPAFNVGSLEMVRGALRAAEELDVPVIIQIAERLLKYSPLELIGPGMVQAARESRLPVAVNFDHSSSFEVIEKALQLGFTSVMFDGSTLPFEENIRMTRKAVELAEKYGTSIERMVGFLDGIDDSLKESNNLEEFKKYIDNTDNDIKKYSNAVQYGYNLSLNVYKEDTSNGVVQVNPSTLFERFGMTESSDEANYFMGSNADVWTEMIDNDDLMKSQYDLVAGQWPKNYNEVILIANQNNEVSDYTLYALGIKDQNEITENMNKLIAGEKLEELKEESYSYDEILGLKYKILLNTDYYIKQGNSWITKKNDESFMKKKISEGIDVKIVGIVKSKDEATATSMGEWGVIGYSKDLTQHIINEINQSQIAKEQLANENVNVFTGTTFDSSGQYAPSNGFDYSSLTEDQQEYMASLSQEEMASAISSLTQMSGASYEQNLITLGICNLDKPAYINIYPIDFESKDKITADIEKYNEQKRNEGKDEDVIEYTDMVATMMNSVTVIVNIISYVLIAFVSISLVVSSIMIGIITYISVLERIKEIGILRSIGASKKDISRVFNAETFIVGLVAGVLGIGVTLLLNLPINMVIKKLANVSNLSKLPIVGAVVLILISMILTMIAGLIPAKIASKKDPVEALRTE